MPLHNRVIAQKYVNVKKFHNYLVDTRKNIRYIGSRWPSHVSATGKTATVVPIVLSTANGMRRKTGSLKRRSDRCRFNTDFLWLFCYWSVPVSLRIAVRSGEL